MSSLAASRADNFYHPPDWDPSKTSRKKFQNSSGHNQYEKYGIIRFELMYDAWCKGCGRHYGKGTRFNAKKEKDGKYFSTNIYKFTMRCHTCPQTIVVATDPKNTDYEFREGLQKKDEEFSVKTEDGVDDRIQEKLDEIYKVGGHAAEQERHDKKTNAIYKLEHEKEEKRRVASESERLEILYELGEARRLYDYDANAALRQTMRGKRRAEKDLEEESKQKGLSITLLPHDEADAHTAAEVISSARRTDMKLRDRPFRVAESKQMLGVKTESIFGESSLEHKKHLRPAMLKATVPALKYATPGEYDEERPETQPTGVLIKKRRKVQSTGSAERTSVKKTTTQRAASESNSLSALCSMYDDGSGDESEAAD